MYDDDDDDDIGNLARTLRPSEDSSYKTNKSYNHFHITG
jgi:hypothetical protein